MPLFSTNKFLPKKTPPRKIGYNFPKRKPGEEDEFKFEIDKIKLNVGEQNCIFEDGEWIPENGVSGHRVKEHQRLKQQLQQMETENNFLKLKNEVLLDMDQKENRLKKKPLKDTPVKCIYIKAAKRSRKVEKEDKKNNFDKLNPRDIFENMFPELKNKRKSKERFEKIKSRCISEADFEEVMKFLNKEAEMVKRIADIPTLVADPPQCSESCLCLKGEKSGGYSIAMSQNIPYF